MTRWPLLRVPALAGILAFVAPAAAAEAECAGLRLEVDSTLAQRFPDLAAGVRAAFSARDDMEACPDVELAAKAHEIELRVALADGRSAVRSVARPDDVVPTLQALVIVPERADARGEASRPSDAAPASRAVKPVAAKDAKKARPGLRAQRAPSREVVADRGVFPAPPAASAPSALRIELSAAVGAHSGENSRSSLNFGLQSLLDIHRFLGGFQVRIDQYQGMAEGMGSAFELSALAGRRFDFGVMGLDLLIGPTLASQPETTTIDERAVPGSRMPPPTTNGGGNAAYAFFSARSSFFPDSHLRPFVAGDAALRLDQRASPDADLFPTWNLGVSVGATVGTL